MTDQAWKNKNVSWDQFVAKCSTPVKGAETYKAFMAASKKQQSIWKDSAGGFIGGYMNGGKRKKSAVVSRSLVTLDVDYAEDAEDFYKTVAAFIDHTFVIYSTGKHCAETPRLRLVIPLSRDVTREEYEPLARKIAGIIGINLFDSTTYQAQRVMFWPRVSKNGDFYFRDYRSDTLDPDDFLAEYGGNWQDSSLWPLGDGEVKAVRAKAEKQGDPTEKPGIVGQFCRTYDIHEAIDSYLPDIYQPTSIDDRYTYVHGSTAAGLVVYDNLYAYSHHGTDPCSLMLCNSFDLCRIHLFGDLDEDPDTPITKRPSYLKMCDMAREDKHVIETSLRERMDEFADLAEDVTDPGDDDTETGEKNTEWIKNITLDRNNNIEPTINNCVTILRNDLKADLFLNDFDAGKRCVNGSTPWLRGTGFREWTDADDSFLCAWFEKWFKSGLPRQNIKDAVSILFENNRRHPVREFLLACEADGCKDEYTCEEAIIDYLGAKDTDLTREMSRKWAVAAVKRIMEPGCKFDPVLTLIGPQGIGKSSFSSLLGNVSGQRWKTDSFHFGLLNNGNKAFEAISGKWLVEVPELAGLSRADVGAVKHFFAKDSDVLRQAYGHYNLTFLRQNVFVLTTNDRDFLTDDENRRFWIIDCHGAPWDIISTLGEEWAREYWASAMYWYRQGESLELSRESRKKLEIEQRDYREADPWEDAAEALLDAPVPEGWQSMDTEARRAYIEYDASGTEVMTHICVRDVWEIALGRTLRDFGLADARRVGRILKTIAKRRGLERCMYKRAGVAVKGYRITTSEA